MKRPFPIHLRAKLDGLKVPLVVFWFITASFVLMAMGLSLWWARDRLLYADKHSAEQRIVVFERAGLHVPAIANAAEFVEVEGSDRNARYRIRGDFNTASYIKYLLAPRIPDGSGEIILNIDQAPQLNREPATPIFEHDDAAPLSLAGWFISTLVVSGCGYLMARVLSVEQVCGLPAIVGMGVLVVGLMVILSRALGLGMGGAGTVSSLLAAIGLWLRWREQRSLRWHRLISEISLWNIGLLFLSVGSVWLAWRLATIVVPDDWDAWAIWGAKAKVLALGRGPLSDVIHFGHADYPLLWPSVWALSAWCSGGWEEQWARGWSAIFFGLTGWQLAKTARYCGAPLTHSLFGAALFLSVPKAIVVASWSYAESLLWLFTSLSFDRTLRFAKEHQQGDALWATLFAVGAAYTKNEGIFFAVLLMCLLLFVARSSGRWGALLRSLGLFALMYGPWMLWTRHYLGLKSHATEGLAWSRIHEVADRLAPGIEQAIRVWMDFQQWGVALVLIIAGWMASLMMSRGKYLAMSVFPVLYLGGLFSVIIAHTAEIGWQVGTAWDRLTLQAVPVFIASIFWSHTHKQNTLLH